MLKTLIFFILSCIFISSLYAETRIYDKNYNMKERIDDKGRIYDKNYNLKGRIQDNKVYDKNYNLEGRIEKNR